MLTPHDRVGNILRPGTIIGEGVRAVVNNWYDSAAFCRTIIARGHVNPGRCQA